MIHVVDIEVPLGLSAMPAVIKKLVPEVLTMVDAGIRARATRELTSTSANYIDGLSKKDFPINSRALSRGVTVKGGEIVLTGWLPNAVEHGWGGGDMKPTLLRGRTARTGKNGPYATVKFIHGTPGSSGRSKGVMGGPEAKQGVMSRAQAELLGKRIHNEAKKLAASTSQPGRGTTWGQRLNSSTTYMLGARKLKTKHTNDVYAGMIRESKTYFAARDQNQYATFRRVSARGSAGKWIHPGIRPHHFFEKEVKNIDKYVRVIMRGMVFGGMRGFGGKG